MHPKRGIWPKGLDIKSGLAYAYKSIGLTYYFKSVPFEAVLNWEQSLATFTEINDLTGSVQYAEQPGGYIFQPG